MTDIGHNSPPAFEAHSLHIEDLFALVSDSTAGGKVTTDEQEAALDALMDDLRKARKAADAERAAEKKPHDDAAKTVQAKWKPLIERCDAGVEYLKGLLTPYRVAKQRAKDEAIAKARAEAEAKERAAQEALRKSDDLEARFEAEQTLKQAQKQAAAASRVEREATGLRTRQIAVVEDYKALLQHIMREDQEPLKAWLDDYARRALPRKLPGCRIEIERRAA